MPSITVTTEGISMTKEGTIKYILTDQDYILVIEIDGQQYIPKSAYDKILNKLNSERINYCPNCGRSLKNVQVLQS